MNSQSIAPLRLPAVFATVGLVCSMLVKSAIVATDLWTLRAFGTVNPDLPSVPVSDAADRAVPWLGNALSYAGITDLVLFIAAAVAVVAFFHRAYRNIMQPVIANRRYSPGWTIAAFLIPGVNAVMPYLVIREICKCSRTLVRKHVDGHWEEEKPSRILPFWWWSTILAFIVLDVLPRFSSGVGMLAMPAVSASLHVAGTALYVTSCCLAVALIWRISRMHWRMRVHAHRAEMLRSTGEPPRLEPWLDRMSA